MPTILFIRLELEEILEILQPVINLARDSANFSSQKKRGHRAFQILGRELPSVDGPGIQISKRPMKCLAKHPDERWQSASDPASELKWITESGGHTGRAAPSVASGKTRERD